MYFYQMGPDASAPNREKLLDFDVFGWILFDAANDPVSLKQCVSTGFASGLRFYFGLQVATQQCVLIRDDAIHHNKACTVVVLSLSAITTTSYEQ